MRSNAGIFRSMARAEEAMMRAAMPRVNRLDPVKPKGVDVLLRQPRALQPVRTLTFRIAEVA